MQSIALTSTERTVIERNNGLSLYLKKMDTGREATPRSWLYEKEPIDKVLERWLTILDSVTSTCQDGDLVNQFDREQIKKFGPQGKVPPVDQGLKELEDSYSQSIYDREFNSFIRPNSEDEYDAQQLAKLLMGKRALMSLRPKSFKYVVDDMRERDTLETNSGWPLFTRRKLSTVIDDSIRDAETGKAYEYPAILLFRSYNGKLRPVWMYPMSMNLIEGSFTQIIQDCIREAFAYNSKSILGKYITPWIGFEDVKVQFTDAWKKYPVSGGDTTKMDAHFRLAQMRTVFDIVKWMFQRIYWDDLWKCMRHVNDISVVYNSNAKLTGLHGIASGSGWTQLSETIFQMWMAWRLPGIQSGMGIGDDFVWFCEPQLSANGLVLWLKNFGLPANAAKQTVSETYCTFLQRMFIKGHYSRDDKNVLGGIYPTIRALNSSLNPEKFHDPRLWNSDMFCARQYMILENTVDHPAFEQFCDFVVKGQKDLVPFAKKSASELNRISLMTRLIPQLNPSYNQEKRDRPLSSFSSIRYVAEHS